MAPNPFFGVFLHWLGGLASASFYVPYRGVKRWSWETYWLVGGVFSWLVAPWFFASLLAGHQLLPTLGAAFAQHASSCGWTFLFGVLWGVGGLTFGLTMRYLGISLGMAVALGYCAAFGTLMPPLFKGTFVPEVLGTASGRVILGGVLLCLVGIGVAGLAGMSKEKEMPAAAKRKTVREFNFKKGIGVATFSGVMSACFAYGLSAGDPIKAVALAHGVPELWQGLPVLIILLAGGFATNFIWCVLLHVRNGTGGQYFSRRASEVPPRGVPLETAIDAPSEEVVRAAAMAPEAAVGRVPLLANYCFAALAGVTWYLQFFFYSMGETQMGRYGFSSWTLHMASIIIFSSLWGIGFHEWKGSSRRTIALLGLGLAILVGSTVVVGYGNYLGVGH
jgi:L-rhamnose-H+ transport protein